MAVSSPLNPASIARERPTTAAAAQNFITGGSPLGEGVVASAANKIVGFQRGAAAVAARPPDLQGIIQTLSTNILNNVESRVQSINQNVTQLVNNNLKSLGDDYKSRLNQIDSTKPNSILSNFLKLYQQAIGYIQFLGNRKNVKTLGDNIQSLQRIFAETFEVAKIIRQTIIKIVKQLSNLPTASTGGGGLNLDVNVPGGPLKRSAPRGITRMLKMAGTGAAVAGAGALGTKVVSGMMDVGGQEVQAVPSSGSEGLSGPILDRFNAILERFSAAIDSISKKKSVPPPPPASNGDGGGTQEKKDTGGKTGGGVTTGTGSDSAGENIAAFTATLEASGDQNQADVMQVMVNRAKGNSGKLAHEVTGKNAFSPMTAAIYGAQGLDEDADKMYGHIAPLLGKTPEERKVKLNQIAAGPDGLNNLAKLFKKGDPAAAARVINDFKTGGPLSAKSRADVGGGIYFKGRSYKGGGVYLDRGSNKFHTESDGSGGKGGKTYQLAQGVPTATAPPKPGVAAAPTPAATQQQIAQTVAQPAQQKPQVTVLPMAMNTGTSTPPKPPSSGRSPAPNMTGGRMLPAVSSANHDNFLTLYSKMVYNIVDG